jgi:hypothetical protein
MQKELHAWGAFEVAPLDACVLEIAGFQADLKLLHQKCHRHVPRVPGWIHFSIAVPELRCLENDHLFEVSLTCRPLVHSIAVTAFCVGKRVD